MMHTLIAVYSQNDINKLAMKSIIDGRHQLLTMWIRWNQGRSIFLESGPYKKNSFQASVC